MPLFTASQEQQAQFDAYEVSLAALTDKLRPLAPEKDIRTLETLKADFHKQIADFFQENRRLNIGVVGQVKAGKSSFLNTLLFDGKSVLPKAATPKTAVLTKIEYSENSRITVRYLQPEQWDAILQHAASAEDDDIDEMFQAAKELKELQMRSGIAAADYLGKIETFDFDDPAEFQNRLNDYVGENGRYMPLVESVTLGLPLAELQEISIVDTPGLNDPVASRTTQTKEFLKVCDVVFFLSQSGSFLDSNDWALLSQQLPSEGVKRFVLIASKADSALQDVLRQVGAVSPFDEDFGNAPKQKTLAEALDEVRDKLGKRAQKQVQYQLRRDPFGNETMSQTLSDCADPIPVSSMLENMRKKAAADYDNEEKMVYRRLQSHFQNETQDMERISNFSAVRDVFTQTVQKKDQILKQKAEELLPTVQQKLRGTLNTMQAQTVTRMDLLRNRDAQSLKERMRTIDSQRSGLRDDIRAIFAKTIEQVEREKKEQLAWLEESSRHSTELTEHTGSREITTYHTRYKHKFLWWEWGKEEYERTRTEYYSYLCASDAAEKIQNYAQEVISGCASIFDDAVDLSLLRMELLRAVVRNLAEDNDHYDAELNKRIAEDTIARLKLPELNLSFDRECRAITAEFSGNITSSSEQARLKSSLAHAVSQVLHEAGRMLGKEISRFQDTLRAIGEGFVDTLMQEIMEEYQDLIKKFDDKQEELRKCQQYIDVLNKER